MKYLSKALPLFVVCIGLVACEGGGGDGGGGEDDSTPKVAYEILISSEVPDDLMEFDAQDLSAAHDEPSGTLKMAFEGALARYEAKHGRAPQDDFETAVAISDWVAFNLRHPHFYPEDPSLPRFYSRLTPDPKYNSFYNDPVEIIRYTLSFDPADAVNWPSPFCTQQNHAAAGIMNYAGLHARLCTVNGHDGLEYYSWKYHKWIWMDSTFNEHFILPLPNGTVNPLGAKELQELTLYGGIQDVLTIKHGYPDGKTQYYNYLNVNPHGFRRYAPCFYMKTLNGQGIYLSRDDTVVSRLPVPSTYIPNPGEIVKLENVQGTSFSLWPYVQDQIILDTHLDVIEIDEISSSQSDRLDLTLKSYIPYTTSFEIQYGDKSPWQILEDVTNPIGTSKTSSSFGIPWNAGIVSFRAKDRVGNVSKTLKISLIESK